MGTICLLRATIRFSFKNAGTVVAKQVKYAKGNRSDIDGKEKQQNYSIDGPERKWICEWRNLSMCQI